MRLRLMAAGVAAATVSVAFIASAPATARPVDTATATANALKALRSDTALAGADSAAGFAVRDVIRDADGTTHVRADRTYHGLPVLGGDQVVHLTGTGAVRGSSGGLRTSLNLSLIPRIAPQGAAGLAKARFVGIADSSSPKLVVDALHGAPKLAWETIVRGARPDQTPSELHVILDAATGAVIDQWDAVETGTGNGFHVGTVTVGTRLNAGVYELKDPNRGLQATNDKNNKGDGFLNLFYTPGTLVTDADDVWGDGTLTNRQTVAVDAHYGAGMTWDYYKNVHGRNGIANDGKGALSRVHFSTNYNNAFWQDSCFCMTYGDGDGTTFWPFTSIDVAGHEMSHGVTSKTAKLTYSGESGGLNESTSDIFGTSVEFYAASPNDNPDYLIGEKIRKNGVPLRWMDQPSKDGSSADCWSSSVGNLDVHYSSGVGNHFFYLLSEGSGAKTINGVAYNSPTCNSSTVTGITRAKAEKIWYRALTTYMTSSTNYAGARTASLSAATDLYGAGSAEYNAVNAAWAAVSVS